MSFFQIPVLNKYINSLDKATVADAFTRFKAYFHNTEIQQNIRNSKEEQFQEGFLRELFVKILGYTLNPQPNYNLTTEYKNEKGSKKVDGAILKDGKALGVIELKGTDTKDLDKINIQAFDYKNNHSGCVYVITSNFEKLRFYIHDSVNFIEFNLFTLSEQEFTLLWLCLSADNLLGNIPLNIKEESLVAEEQITKKLYADYATFKNDLWHNITTLNPKLDKLHLYKKTQKLLDRFLFILFAEDSGLLPPNAISRMIKRWEILKQEDAYKPVYDIFKQYFGYLNKGRKGQTPQDDIYAYNGGLFLPDNELDVLKIDDDVLLKHLQMLTRYNFVSEVDVNILGHIFENSLNEIENVTARLEGKEVDKSKTKRKKDGVYYTPKYITKYIVENTVGKLCNEKKAELGIVDEEYAKGRRNRKQNTIVKLDKKLKKYREWLLGITICDPACGSGAFLNQALEFLIAEHKFIDELHAQLLGDSIVFPDVSAHILEKNLYGVDINDESVEIAKLSLWLRTAKRGRKLITLKSNIKCGNSLIDDPEVAGKKAFNWKKEFPGVFEKGGFDVVIGNPPYGILIDDTTKNFYAEKFPLTQYKINLYVLFLERMLQVFEKGIIHFIIPKSLLFNTYYESIRRKLIEETELKEIFTITEKVFEDAEVGSSLLLQFKIKNKIDENNIVRLASADKTESFITGVGIIENNVRQNYFLNVPNCEISVVSADSHTIIKKLHKLKPIRNYYMLRNGLNPGNIKHILITDTQKTEKHKPIIWGKDITRYNISWSEQYVNYNAKIGDKISLNNIQSKDGMNKQNRIDFALRSPQIFENKKIVVRKTGDALIGCLDEECFYFDTLVHGIYEKVDGHSLEALLALLNSKPATKFYRLLHNIEGKVFAKISLDNLSSFPIPELSSEDSNSLVEKAKFILAKTKDKQKIRCQMLDLLQSKFDFDKFSNRLKNWYNLDFKEFLKELKKSKVKLSLLVEAEWMEYFNNEKQKVQELQSEIEKTEKEIDHMVYDLYDLTEDEIKVIEES